MVLNSEENFENPEVDNIEGTENESKSLIDIYILV